MNEEKLASFLAEHLDALLAGAPLSEGLPGEVAELLTIAQDLSETTPIPRPEFGPALKESLLGPAGGSNGASPGTGSTFTGQLFFIVIIALLVLAAGLVLIISGIMWGVARSNLVGPSSPTTLPVETRPVPAPTLTQPAGSPPPIQTQSAPVIPASPQLTPTVAATTPTRPADPIASPTRTATPIVDVLPVITVTIEILIEPPDLIPGPDGGGGIPGPNGGGGDGGSGGDDDDDDDDDDD